MAKSVSLRTSVKVKEKTLSVEIIVIYLFADLNCVLPYF